jgi:tetratricopeptide (TPR) repeat protein
MNLDTLFSEALAQPDADREAFVAAHCADEPTRQKLHRLLAAHARAGQFLSKLPDTPVTAADTRPQEDDADGPMPEVLGGRYRVTGVLGRGGMGIVYRAEQTDPIRRAVAVKVVRPGAASAFVLGRFEAERQTVAAMSHPNIATVYDGGTTPDGRPFFVMELVDGGLPVTQFCGDHRLPFADRLALFRSVCEAVQHAHQRGVLHRDLKPSNVLVTVTDGRPVVKVIDFGVAKALDVQAGQTRPGTLIGTPEYMSPEQADLSSRDIDVRADVYSLAVLLYELVTGDTPIPRERVRQSPLLDVLQAVRGEEPPAVGARRRGLPPELDWILAKGLSKDRDRRYASVAAFADDLTRMTRHEAVSAAPVRGWYRAAKFVRRNWLAVGAAVAVAAALLAGTAGTTLGMLRAQDAERAAEARRVEAERATERESEQLHQAEVVVGILESAFANLDSTAAAGDLRQKLLRRLDDTAAQIDADHAANPVARIRLKYVLGHVYLGADEPRKALPLFRAASEEAVAHYGEDHEVTWKAKTSYANALASQGRYADAGEVYATLRPRMEQGLGPHHHDVLNVRLQSAVAVSRTKGWADALPLFEAVHADAKAHLASDDVVVTLSRLGVAGGLMHCQRSAEGMALLEEEFRTAADRRPTKWTAEVYEQLFASYVATGQPRKCLPVLERIIAYYQADAPEHIMHRRYASQLRLLYKQLGDDANEEKALLDLLALCRRYDGEKSLNAADTLHALGDNRLRQKKPADAVAPLTDALKVRQELKPDGWLQYDTHRLLGEAYLAVKKFADAERHLLAAHDGLTKLRGAKDPLVTRTRGRLHELYTAWEKPDEAEKWKAAGEKK